MSGAPSPGNTVGYCGYQFDPAVGLYLVRNRWYSPALGQWLTRDPEEYPDGMSLYQYAASFPLYWTDPMGLAGLGWKDLIDPDLWRRGIGEIPGVWHDWWDDPAGMLREVQEDYCDLPGWLRTLDDWTIDVGGTIHLAACPSGKGFLYAAIGKLPGGRIVEKIGKEVVKRVAGKYLRKAWVRLRGKAWPQMPNGSNYHAAHRRALRDGGSSHPRNIDPMTPQAHLDSHVQKGDFVRWGKRANRRKGRRTRRLDQGANPPRPYPLERAAMLTDYERTALAEARALRRRVTLSAKDRTRVGRSLRSATRHLQQYGWYKSPLKRKYAGGVPGVVDIFLFIFEHPISGTDRMLWVIGGDLPSAYCVVKGGPTSPIQALEACVEMMSDWIAAATTAPHRLAEAYPVDAPPTEENARALASRLRFIKRRILPALADGTAE